MTENECRAETQRHIDNVRAISEKVICLLEARINAHDKSKMESPEIEKFTEFTPKLAASTYGSDEYKGFLSEMNKALTHHYESNRHHPEHFNNGISGMNIIDLVEMICDWKAASMRHADGDIRKSIEINVKRFEIGAQLRSILENTAEML